ncbi:MAG TPA: hypothetical protein PLI95_30700, partial [Polyangiaceae bacterium]|nr:hypothetical protein [Polyangiaceae bacterium]
LIGGGTMLGAFALTLGLMHQHAKARREPDQAIVAGASSGAVPRLVELRVIATPASAEIAVDGVVSSDGVVRGGPGAIRRVRVSSAGHRPWEQTVVLDGSARELRVELTAVADAGEVADSPPTKIPAQPVRTTAASSSTATSKPAGPSIAPGLKLKTDGP